MRQDPQHATLTVIRGQGADMKLPTPVVAGAVVGAGVLARRWRPAWWYAQNVRRFHSETTSDHATLSFTEPGMEAVIGSHIRVAQVGPAEWVWHTAVGYPHDPDAEGYDLAGVLGVRVVECVQGMADSREEAQQQAFIHLGVKIGPYLPEPETQE